MIKSKNIFYTTILPTFLIVKTNYNLFLVNVLKNKTKTKIKFKNKNNKKNYIINNTSNVFNFFLSFNKTLHINKNNFINTQKILSFLLKYKLKWNFKKIKYRGKGFKVKKFNKLCKITFRLGKSHWTKLLYNNLYLIVRRTKKNTYCFISIKNKIFIGFKKIIVKIKGINRYTKRGLRLTRQFIKKRFGKISQASSVFNR